MHPWHQETLDRAIAHYSAAPGARAILLGGSVAKGLEREDSDVDLMVIVTSEEYERRLGDGTFVEVRFDLQTYEGGYTDTKFHDESFLLEAADHGSEPARNAFVGAKVVWGGFAGLDELIPKIARYPESEREGKIRSFWGQLCLQRYFIGQSFKHADHLMQVRTADETVFWSARMLLAYHRVLFPSPPRLMQKVAGLPSLPGDYLQLCDELLKAPSVAGVEAVVQSIESFHPWGLYWHDAHVQFTIDTELAWRTGRARLEDS